MIERRLEDAVKRVRQGEKDAFSDIVDETLVMLRAYATFYLCDDELVEDVLQETYMRIYQQIDRYVAGSDFLAWAKAITRFVALSERKKAESRASIERRYRRQLALKLGDAVGDAEEDPAVLERKLAALRKCMARLSGGARRMLTLRYFEGLSLRETARECRVKDSAAGMTLHRTRLALAECIGEAMQESKGNER